MAHQPAASGTPERTAREAILAEINTSGSISTKICVQRLGIPSATAKRQIAELVTAGLLEKEGAGRSTIYRFVSPDAN
ncbi:MAG: DeoR family transcriptional regulator [Chlorobium limicola]|uniref:DeoR family transcriptional regulator n=1 Tax=Chlorobium limicola TaxID=1092 RepID=UPI0023F535B2|nr:DeoR family transcriptional regulator [Chlorobium limicola]NTV08693.1 DeoR family transcriptional regulator [Chlorobium limicola]NTV21037.1 DeoR family transcriptional regulator [Chlorobium limicola]